MYPLVGADQVLKHPELLKAFDYSFTDSGSFVCEAIKALTDGITCHVNILFYTGMIAAAPLRPLNTGLIVIESSDIGTVFNPMGKMLLEGEDWWICRTESWSERDRMRMAIEALRFFKHDYPYEDLLLKGADRLIFDNREILQNLKARPDSLVCNALLEHCARYINKPLIGENLERTDPQMLLDAVRSRDDTRLVAVKSEKTIEKLRARYPEWKMSERI